MKTRLSALAALAGAGALLLAACSSATDSDGSDEASGPASATGANAEVVAKAQEAIADAQKPVDAFTAPGPALDDVASVSGKTVYYMPSTLVAPALKLLGDSLTEALDTAGVKVQVCDAKANPAGAANCLQQAIDSKAAGVITAGVPDEFATTAFDAVRSAGIPLLNMNTIPAGDGDPTKVAWLTPNFVEMQSWNANWVVADSGAEADVLVVKITDNPAVELWMDQGALPVYKACPDCKTTVIETTTGQFQKLPSLVSSELVKDPDIDYIQSPFDGALQPILQGVQSANKTNDVKVVSLDTSLQAMQMLAKGTIKADSGFNNNALGWYGADQMLRMLTGAESIPNEAFPYRGIFDQERASGLTLTPEAEASGEWFGDTTYQDEFQKLWGVS